MVVLFIVVKYRIDSRVHQWMSAKKYDPANPKHGIFHTHKYRQVIIWMNVENGILSEKNQSPGSH